MLSVSDASGAGLVLSALSFKLVDEAKTICEAIKFNDRELFAFLYALTLAFSKNAELCLRALSDSDTSEGALLCSSLALSDPLSPDHQSTRQLGLLNVSDFTPHETISLDMFLSRKSQNHKCCMHLYSHAP